jgi:O-antigen ligase
MNANRRTKELSSASSKHKAIVWIGYFSCLTTLAITPFTAFDVINVVKLFILSIAGFWSFSFLLTVISGFRNFSTPHRTFLALGGLLAVFLLIALSSELTLGQSIYGIYGRNTGLLAYFSLLMILLAATFVEVEKTFTRVLKTLLLTGTLVGAYCLIQFLGLDPIEWTTLYKPIYGTLGNPNFSSAFLGMSVSAGIVLLFWKKSILYRISIGTFLGMGFFLTLATESWQGTIMILAAGFMALTFQIQRKIGNKPLTLSAVFVGLFGGTLGFLGMMGMGPLGSILEKSTLAIRIEYWRTAISALEGNLFFGVGIDGFGDLFRIYRDQKSLEVIDESVWTNSAHNVYLDFALSFGLIALLLLFAIKLIVLFVALKHLKASQYRFDSYMGLFLAWVSYEIQAMISINHLGVGIWGWFLTGLIFGGAVLAQDPSDKNSLKAKSLASKSNSVSEVQPLLWFTGAVVGLLVALPSYLADSRFYASLQSERLELIVAATKAFPVDAYRIIYVIDLLDQANLDTQAAELVEYGVTKFPTNYTLHLFRSKLPATSPENKVLSEQIMAQLNPLVDGRP